MPVRILQPVFSKRQQTPGKYRDNKTAEERKLYSSHRWTLASRRHRRDEPLCRECSKRGETTLGNVTDHIQTFRDGADFWDETNWQTLCHNCHNQKRQRESMRASSSELRTKTRVIIVSGLPGAGKTTYVREKMRRGDLIVDMDAIFSALSGETINGGDGPAELLPFACEARDAIIARLERSSEVRTAFLITTRPDQAENWARQFNGEHVRLEVDEAERRRRLEAR